MEAKIKKKNVLELPTKPPKALDEKLTLKLFRSFLVLWMGAIIQNVAILKVEKTPINTLNHHHHHHHHLLALLFGTHHNSKPTMVSKIPRNSQKFHAEFPSLRIIHYSQREFMMMIVMITLGT